MRQAISLTLLLLPRLLFLLRAFLLLLGTLLFLLLRALLSCDA